MASIQLEDRLAERLIRPRARGRSQLHRTRKLSC